MRSLVVFLILLAPVFAADGGAVTQKPEVASAIRVFETWLQSQMAYRGLPGVAVGVVYDQDLVWSRGFGLADVEKQTPVTPRTLFRMASNTKMFTAISVLQLRDAGKLRLDDPVSKYLPWFHVKPADEDDGPITVAHLMMHASGLPREAASNYWNDFEFPTVAQIEKTVSMQKAPYAPDVRWKYSNLAVGLAGLVVEAVSKEKYSDYVENHILKPLTMTSSSIDKNVPELAVGYGRRMPDGSRMRMKFMDCRGLAPAAGLSSNVEDMAKFISLQFRRGKAGGNQILASGTLREMRRVHMLENDWQSGTGYGFAVRRVKDKLYTGHGGSLAGYKTQTTFLVDDKIGVVVLTNGDDAGPGAIADRLMEIVGEAVVKVSKPVEKPKLWDPAWVRFAGLYRDMWSDVEIVAEKDELVSFNPESADPKAAMQRLVAKGGGVFVMEGKSGGGPVGEIVTFVEAGGRVKAMKVSESVRARVN